ncbi:MAG: YIP1 family protein [Anaerobacillus sp.]
MIEKTVQEEQSEQTSKPSLLGMIWSPGEQFEKVRHHPKVWIPLLVVTVLSLLSGWLMTIGPGFEEQLTGPGIDQENIDGVKLFAKITTVVGAGLSPAFGVLISSFIFWLITKATSSEVTFKKLFSMNTYITFISILGLLLNGVLLAILGGSIVSYTSIGSLIDADGGFGAFLNSIEIFSIWTMILTGIGLQITARWSKVLAWTITIIFFLLSVGFAVIGGMASTMTGM